MPIDGARRLTAAEQQSIVVKLKKLWKRHDQLEREILLLERKLPDRELKRIGAAASG